MIEIDPEDLPFLPGMRLASREPLVPRDPDAFIRSFPAKRCPRRPTIRTIEKETGRIVTSITVAPDGTALRQPLGRNL
jgi:hypothetical protein